MRILGIDPGFDRIGYGVVDREGSKLSCVEYGLVSTPKIGFADRLGMAHAQLLELMQRTRPDALATEKLLFSVNRKTALDVAKALGVILLAGNQCRLDWTEYSPQEVKQSVVGNGAADKRQVQYMVTRLLSLAEPPKPDDVADALGIAICHAMRSRLSVTR